ncbi:MAG: transcriptional regulator [Acidobacteriaceae bacterium]|jgi:hypothetical protein
MPLSRSFNLVYRPYFRQDAASRRETLVNAATALLANDLDTAKSLLRLYINATVGFIPLGAALGQSPKVLMRVLSPRGNPQTRTLFHLFAHLQRAEGVTLIATEAPPPQSVST